MAGEITLDINSDARGAVRGIKDVGDALETVVRDLADVEEAGDKTERSLEQSFRDIAKAAKKEGERSGQGLRKGLKEGTDEAKGEALSSGKEAAASFGGGFEDVADFLQETLANAFAGFGPIGAAAGIALAAVVGVALGNAAATQEKLAEAREAAADLATTMYENRGKLPIADRVDDLLQTLTGEIRPNGVIQGWIDQWVDFGDRLSSIKRTAEQTRVPIGDLVDALSGADLAVTKETLRLINDELKKMEADPTQAWVWDTAPLVDTKNELEKIVTQTELAAEAQRRVASSLGYKQQIEELGAAWRDAAADAGDYVVATEDGVTFDAAAYLKEAEAQITAANEVKRRLVTLPPEIRTEAMRVFADQGAVAADAYVDAYEKASAEDKSRFTNAAKANGEAAGAAQGASLANAAHSAARATAQGLGPIPIGATISGVDDRAVRNYRPPIIYIPGQITVNGGRVPV